MIMNTPTPAIFYFTLVLLVSGVHLTTVTITNKCAYTIWPASLTTSGGPQLSTTGFELTSQATRALTILPPWSGRFWARTQCSANSTGNFTCLTADCRSGQLSCSAAASSPASVVEFTIGGVNGQDAYDISLVDGYNLPISVAPQGGVGNNCTAASCAGDVVAVCPAELQVRGFDGSVIACKSACAAFNQPQYCCGGSNYNTSTTCPPTTYSTMFANMCPDAYSYPSTNRISRFACIGVITYDITFCT